MNISQLASAVRNHVYDGLRGAVTNQALSIEQLEDEVVAERNTIIKEYFLKGVILLQELYSAINCVPVDCESMAKCCNLPSDIGKKALHFEIPPILMLNGANTIAFVGSIDRQEQYSIYTDVSYKYHFYKKRGSKQPFVYIDPTINNNGNMDGYIFNVPLVKYISIVAIFMDPRKLCEFSCCANDESLTDMGVISNDILHRLTEKYIRYYRQLQLPINPPNTQAPL